MREEADASDTREGAAAVLAYHEYLGGKDSQTVSGTRYFCGACRRGIGGVYGSACYGFPEYPEDVEERNEAEGFALRDRDETQALEYYAFCPWCGAAFADEWWKDRTIQNERAIDHYRDPGTHKGDTHEFRGDGPDCMAGHWLAVSGGTDEICWCDPEVIPGLMGCTIRHQAKRYEDVMALRREMRSDDEEVDDDDPPDPGEVAVDDPRTWPEL